MIGEASADRAADRHQRRSQARFGPNDLRSAVHGLTWTRTQRLILAAHGLTLQITEMARSGRSVMHEVLGAHATAEPWVQYPAQMVENLRTGAGFFFHSHGPSQSHPDERGHFHVFVRGLDARQSHLFAIAIDPYGMPIRLFTTNRWVTAENWSPAETLLAGAEKFSLLAPSSNAGLDRWVTHCVRLFLPQLQWLVYRRDARLRTLAAGRDVERVLADRRIEILSECRISVGEQMAALQASLDA
ncbi:MAG: hypothetical protein NVS9B2_23020 [Steroidobacteraceae bacterium]